MHNPAMMLTSDDIKAVRASLGESQAAFAARFGVDQATIHRWETDGLPKRGTARVAVEQMLAELQRIVPETEKANT